MLQKEKEKPARKRKSGMKTDIEIIFEQTAYLNKKIEIKIEEISYWREFASKAQVVFSAVKSSGSRKSRSKIEECVGRIADIEKSLNEDMAELIGLKEKAMHIIDKISEPEYRNLLMHRYLFGKKWEEVANSMGYSYVHIVNRLHPKALKKVNEIGADD